MTFMTTFVERKIQNIVDLARRLAVTRGGSERDFRLLREAVAGDILNGSMRFVPEAMARVKSEPAYDMLHMMCSHCTQFFYIADRVIGIMAIPMEINLKSRVDGQARLDCASRHRIDSLARMLKISLEARELQIDHRLYASNDLIALNTAQVRDIGLALERGQPGRRFGPGPRIVSRQEGCREVTYLVGVITHELNEAPPLLVDELRERAVQCLHLAKDAVDCSDAMAWSQGIACEIKVLGIAYLGKALALGDGGIKEARLLTFLDHIGQSGEGVSLWALEDGVRSKVALIAHDGSRYVEYVWSMRPGETFDSVTATINEVLKRTSANLAFLHEIDEVEYAHLATRAGLIPYMHRS